MEKTIEQIKKEALKELEAASDSESIKALSVRYLGRKGAVTQYLRNISNLPKESRPEAGKKANQTKRTLDELLKTALKRQLIDILGSLYVMDFEVWIYLANQTF